VHASSRCQLPLDSVASHILRQSVNDENRSISTLASLFGMCPTLFAYVLSFVIIATYWVNHHYLIYLVTRVDATILWANMNLLFWISLIPWVTGYRGDNHALPFPVALYPAVPAAGAISFFFLRAS